MKKLALIFFLATATFLLAQDHQVTNTGKYSVDYPHLDYGGNTVNLVYGTNFSYYNFGLEGPTSPFNNRIIPANNYGPNTTDIAVDPADTNHIAIVYYDFHYETNAGVQFYGCYITESTDRGVTFDAPTLLDTVEYGNTLSNLYYNMPQVKFLFDGTDSQMKILWEVHQNKVDTNAIYLGGRYGGRERVDDPKKNLLEYAIGFTTEDMLAVSYGVVENGNVKFYLYGSGINGPILVKEIKQDFLTSDNFSKAFINHGGKLEYVFNSFSKGTRLMESNDWGATWQEKGIVDNHPYRYVAIERIQPTPPLYLESYYVKLLEDDNNNLVFWVSKDLLNWQSGGQINSTAAQVQQATVFIELRLDDKNKNLLTTWMDSRTGNSEIFYAKVKLPELTAVKDKKITPSDLNLSQNYPNPFNPSTVIKYSIPAFKGKMNSNRMVYLKVYNILGKEVKTLVAENKAPGEYSVKWDGKNNDGISVPSGVYLYQLTFANRLLSKKMLLIK